MANHSGIPSAGNPMDRRAWQTPGIPWGGKESDMTQ